MKKHQMDPSWGLWNLQNKRHVIFKAIKGMKDGRTVADERKRTGCVTFRKCASLDWIQDQKWKWNILRQVGKSEGILWIGRTVLMWERILVWKKHILECLRIMGHMSTLALKWFRQRILIMSIYPSGEKGRGQCEMATIQKTRTEGLPEFFVVFSLLF